MYQVPRHDVVHKWSHDQKIKAESLMRSASRQGDSYWSGNDMLNDSFEMMHSSPDLFSQSLSVVIVAPLSTNQSERSKFSLDQSESSILPM